MDYAVEYPLESQPVSMGGITHDVWFGPKLGPGVLLLHELTGLSQHTATFGASLMDAGFTVAMPHLFGRVGAKGNEGTGAGIKGLLGLCVAREMSLFLRDQPPKGTEWLKEAARVLGERSDSTSGVGVIGMCATGAFAMASVFDPQVGAVVASQTALPALRRGSWGMPGGDERLAEADTAVMALRFCTDARAGKGRVRRLPGLMNETLTYRESGPTEPSLPQAQRGIKEGVGDRLHVVWAGGRGHSVLTSERVDLAAAAVVDFLHKNLDPVAAPETPGTTAATLDDLI